MRARAAYISSFGTSGILVASALLVLAMASALVAFRGWPEGLPTGERVTAVPVAPSAGSATGLREPARALAPAGRSDGTRAAGASSTAASGGSTVGLYKDSAVEAGSGQVGGMIKVPVVTDPQPVVPLPPPSTGPQQTGAPAGGQPPSAPPRDAPPKGDLVPEVPAAPSPGTLQGTTDGLISTPPEGSAVVDQVTTVGPLGAIQQQLADQIEAVTAAP